MVGDFFGYRVVTPVLVSVPVYNSSGVQIGTTQKGVNVLDVNASRQAIKISEFESPRPRDQVYFSYNFYGNAGGKGGFTPATLDNGLLVGPAGVARRNTNVHRELAGFEKTLLDGNASFGVRVPYIQQTGSGAVFNTDVGDITTFGKYILALDSDTGNLLSTGLVLTLPTGPGLSTTSGTFSNSVLIQPWLGYFVYLLEGDAYMQGFHGIVVPTISRDTTFVNNDLAAGYFLLRPCADRLLSMVAVQGEVHVTTPLNHTGPLSAVPNLVVLTGAMHMGLGSRSILTLGAGTPVTGVRPFDIEGVCQLTFNF